jgi:hypothetical protein
VDLILRDLKEVRPVSLRRVSTLHIVRAPRAAQSYYVNADGAEWATLCARLGLMASPEKKRTRIKGNNNAQEKGTKKCRANYIQITSCPQPTMSCILLYPSRLGE